MDPRGGLFNRRGPPPPSRAVVPLRLAKVADKTLQAEYIFNNM